VAACPTCGKENPEGFQFCGYCAAPLTGESREQHKTVTVLFCDVTGSTALGESTDPEALRALLARYFERMKGIVESHGGTVEKFIGDAVMAVFGVPVVHEDDALRACRAAVEMRDALPELGVRARIGVNTGEVVTGTQERLATGDAVNVAARLEQAAEPGEILIGEATFRLTRDAVEMDVLEPVAVKGKGTRLGVCRLVSVTGEGPARRMDVPMVGRARELRLLEDAWGRALSEQACQLFTVLGAAGVGKSRLALEFFERLAGVTVVRGRCLSYGEGITYWPVVEVVKQLEQRLEALVEDDSARVAIEAMLGSVAVSASSQEIAWAVRKLLEAAASQTPVVCVFDDVHWGEPTFLDLVEHIADLSRNASLLLLCMARPELLDKRPTWGGGKLNATTVLLEPLGEAETELLVAELVAGLGVDEGLRARIREAAEGNPFYCEQIVALLEESAGSEVVVPPTIHALLAARLDQLETAERGVLERGSVEGRVFHRGAVQALTPEDPQVIEQLSSLVRKELVRPDRPQVVGEDAYRFRHLLIRDAAYEALPKATRAELHERFAAWLERQGTTLVELDVILGHHLEQAVRYLSELNRLDEHGRQLAERAGKRLLGAGQRAIRVRADMPAAANLLGRAAALLPADDRERLRTQPPLAWALIETGELAQAEQVLNDGIAAARATGDRQVEARAQLLLLALRLQTDPTQALEDAGAEVERMIGIFEQLDDDEGLGQAWFEHGRMLMWSGQGAAAMDALQEALRVAQRGDDRRLKGSALTWMAITATFGPLPVEDGVRLIEQVRGDPDASSRVQAQALISTGFFRALQGQFDDARSLAAEGRALLRELGLDLDWAAVSHLTGQIELLADAPHAAEAELKSAYDLLQQRGETSYLSTGAAYLAEAMRRQQRLRAADQLIETSKTLSARDDLTTQTTWRTVRARMLAAKGTHEGAERLARESVTMLEPTDSLHDRAETLLCLAEVLSLAGRSADAIPALEQAIELATLKGDTVTARRAHAARTRAFENA
jgi:class 3 adenylate cyclase/tetratricopeptide (TPR) repeat protein